MEKIDMTRYPDISFFEVDDSDTPFNKTQFNPQLAQYLKDNRASTLIDMEDPENH